MLSGDTSSNLGAQYDAEGHSAPKGLGRPVNLVVTWENWQRLENHSTSLSGDPDRSPEAPGDMVTQCFNGFPVGFPPAGTPQSKDGEKQHPFVSLDSHQSSVYASSGSHLIVKFAEVPKEDKAELERQLRNENDAYNKLYGLVVSRCYGECVVWRTGARYS